MRQRGARRQGLDSLSGSGGRRAGRTRREQHLLGLGLLTAADCIRVGADRVCHVRGEDT